MVLQKYLHNVAASLKNGGTVAIAVVAFMGTFFSSANADGWSAKGWQVECYVPSCVEWYGMQSQCTDSAISGARDWSTYLTELERSTPGWQGMEKECAGPSGPLRDQVKQQLETASKWLGGMGFEEPLLQRSPDGKRFMAYVLHPFMTVKYYGGGPDWIRPFYVRPAPGFEDVKHRRIFVLGDKPKDTVHELFHAVQYNSPAWDDVSSPPSAWIEEGTAEAVGLAFAQQQAGAARPYDEILNWQPAKQAASYEDQYFWRRIGQLINAPSDIGYLRELLKTDLDMERGLRGVDACLRKHGGLYDLLPEFYSALDIEREFPSPVTGKTSYYFGKPPEHEVELLPLMDSESQIFSKPELKATAGDASKVRVKHSSDKPVEVEISVVEDLDPLHLIVNKERYDNDALEERNVYRTVLENDTSAEYDVIVANIAENTAQGAQCSDASSSGSSSNSGDSNGDRSYRLKVKLREINCMVRVSVAGSARGGSRITPFTVNLTPDGSAITGVYWAPAPGSVFSFAFGDHPLRGSPLPVGKTGRVPVIIDGNTPAKGRFNSHRKSDGKPTGLAQPQAQINENSEEGFAGTVRGQVWLWHKKDSANFSLDFRSDGRYYEDRPLVMGGETLKLARRCVPN